MMFQEILNTKFFIAGIALVLIMPLAVTESYAEQKYQGAVWQLVYVKSNICHPTDNEVAKMYAELTSSYFELYELENKAIDPYCITESEYENFKNNEDVTLLILMFDAEMGNKFLQPNDLDGV